MIGTGRGAPPRIERLRVRNYRSLRDVTLERLRPMTVLLGPNGSGKSTVFDVFSFLAECFQAGLRAAWDRRGRSRELRTRGTDGPIVIELSYREAPRTPLITYHLAIDDRDGPPAVVEEWLRWKRGSVGQPFRFLDYRNGQGRVIEGESPDESAQRIEVRLRSADLLAVNTLGQLADHPRVAALRDFITGWYVSYLSVADTRMSPEAGPQERLNRTGDNLANVVQFLSERHPQHLEQIFERLGACVPRLERVLAQQLEDGRLLLRIKDAPFSEPILARFASDGTLKMLAYLIVLHDPSPPRFIGIEEPENFLHPMLLTPLGEECRIASARSQLLVTTHSPYFLNAMKPEEVRVLYRDERGYTQSQCLADVPRIGDFMAEGAVLGDLWMEGYFAVGNPLLRHGMPE